jgi:hypothetical protein
VSFRQYSSAKIFRTKFRCLYQQQQTYIVDVPMNDDILSHSYKTNNTSFFSELVATLALSTSAAFLIFAMKYRM